MSSIVSACVVLLLSVLCSGDEDSAAAGEIGQHRPGELHFGFITSFSRSASSYESSQAVPSVDLALEKIAELSVLPDNYTLNYSTIRDSQVDGPRPARAIAALLATLCMQFSGDGCVHDQLHARVLMMLFCLFVCCLFVCLFVPL